MSCAGRSPLSTVTIPETGVEVTSDFELVFIIHGDGNYLFHDVKGNNYKADEEALAAALKVAQDNAHAEVFIFHEKRKRHTLLVFPRHDGEFYYYRNGQLLAHEAYWRNRGTSRYAAEVSLYNQYRIAVPAAPKRLFLYFGHEIPEFAGKGYDASHRDRTFTVGDLADGLKQLSPHSTKFDLVVLSTCFNGTPRTISTLAPYARYIMASPGNLHLSYFDLRPFESLESGLRDGDVSAFAKRCAQASFDRLTPDIQTEITVAVYDVERVQDYVQAVVSAYDEGLRALNSGTPTPDEHCDCADDSVFVRSDMSEGVDVWFRAAQFGRSAKKQSHSGWECPRRPRD